MVHTGCVFVAGIHPSRPWTSGSIESVRWNACAHRLDLGLYSHPKEFGAMESELMLTAREISSLPEKNLLRGGSNSRRCITQDSKPNEPFRPPASTPVWPRGQEDQTKEHVLQRRSLHKATREDARPVSAPLTTRLCDCKQDLKKTATLIARATLIAQPRGKRRRSRLLPICGISCTRPLGSNSS